MGLGYNLKRDAQPIPMHRQLSEFINFLPGPQPLLYRHSNDFGALIADFKLRPDHSVTSHLPCAGRPSWYQLKLTKLQLPVYVKIKVMFKHDKSPYYMEWRYLQAGESTLGDVAELFHLIGQRSALEHWIRSFRWVEPLLVTGMIVFMPLVAMIMVFLVSIRPSNGHG